MTLPMSGWHCALCSKEGGGQLLDHYKIDHPDHAFAKSEATGHQCDGTVRAHKMEAALRQLAQWDMLDACADGSWARKLIADALGES